MRTFLDQGVVTHDGEFFRYSGLPSTARPVQQRLPLLIGAMGGPRSFQLAGEVGDGVQCVGCSRENSKFVVREVVRGAERAGRDRRELDIGAGCLAAVGKNSAAAREAARMIAATRLPSMPPNVLERHGLDPDEVGEIGKAMAAGDVEEVFRRTTPEMGEAFSVAGTPQECVDRIRTDLVEAGIDHVVLAIADPALVETYSGRRLEGVPDVQDQLRLISDRIFPAFADSRP